MRYWSESYLSSIEKIKSKAVIDSNASHEGFTQVINKEQNFFRLKENIIAKDIIVKILFSVWTLVYQSILIIEKKNPSEGSIDGLDDTSITAEAKHSFNITKSRKWLTVFCMLMA